MAKRRNIIWPVSVVAAVAFVATLSIGLVLGSLRSGTGVADRGAIVGSIEYTVRDANGVVKEHKAIHNTILSGLLNDARARLGIDGTTIGNSDLYNNIQAVGSDLSGTTPTNLQLSSNLDANPASGTAATATESGNYTVTKTFTASGASTIEELQLTKGAAANGTAETPGAWQNVSITLASGDTLAVTWTIDID